jgi:hypothetical protein
MDLQITDTQPCIDAVRAQIQDSRVSSRPVWIRRAVDEILHDQPDCGLHEDQLARLVRDLAIRQRCAIDDS